MTETGKAPEYIIDLDAFAPVPKKAVKFQGALYPVHNFMDLPVGNALELLRFEEEVKGQDYHGQVQRARRFIQILVPGMTDEVLDQLTGNQMILLASNAMSSGEVPQMASAEPSVSDTSSPALAGSMAGPGNPSSV